MEKSPMVKRYKDGYRAAGWVVTFGAAVKVFGGLLAVVIVLGAVGLSLSQSRPTAAFFSPPADNTPYLIAGIVFAGLVFLLFWVWGVLIAAAGQMLQASLDTAVSTSRFLTDEERMEAMGFHYISGQDSTHPS